MRRHLLATVTCGVTISASTIAAAVVLAHIVAGIITDPGSATRHGAAIVGLSALWVLRATAQWLQGRLSQRGATAVIGELTGQVLRSVTALPPRRLAADRDAAAVVVTRGLDGLRPYFTGYVPAVVQAAVLTPVAVIVMACYDLQAAAIVVIALPLIPIFMVLIGLVTAERSAAALASMTTLQARLLDLVAGIPTLRAVGRAAGSAQRITELAAAHRRSAMATLRIAFLSSLVLELLATLGVALVAVSVGVRLVYGEVTLTAGLTVLLLAPEVFWPLRRVGAAFHAAQDGKTAAEQAFRMCETQTPTEGGVQVSACAPTIELEGLGSAIEPGRVTVLTGPNGAGKSTALQAILGLATLPSGPVRVDGVDVGDLDLTTWWRHIAWLPHRPVLIPGTVLENLELLGPLDDVERACRDTGFDDVLDDLPDGLNTHIGRTGVGLSLGQRQRLGLTRALGSSARLLLLDEPTAHLDAAMEQRVLQAVVARARAGATVVVVGHRDPVLAIADQVITIGAAHVSS
ncbi:thiol reductant ABC exporter subunit CydD [Mycolicibacterium conceptionense]|uniref:Thiol reductant ABC exporter subunit CydD n=1 Tax=Mycolicibacterium conceptionense TaxID=451644 RepID=A0A1A0PK37_9MYCO|nr:MULTISPECIES: thiol reductant ABC exporter subunit CydD [Mycolicibacterium]MCW1824956.1 thiol reductant ABC exporter subunit CydD [Mycolicibacterium senegalense]OBB10380.1 thiol reductant ABC exporter subunit CydD [Mycolicibacterium conceptionense]OBF05605.1 thiol reductant ABC exporter subunit CydD [Mycolicibacterium conceptionense]OBF13273.1 thiol reductant ABC exporter subunit CydD [Mycolicibacterium conceptionense]OBH91912.1 thiol reductant ABC exporter subunit CydD [Mycolicibacterium c